MNIYRRVLPMTDEQMAALRSASPIAPNLIAAFSQPHSDRLREDLRRSYQRGSLFTPSTFETRIWHAEPPPRYEPPLEDTP